MRVSSLVGLVVAAGVTLGAQSAAQWQDIVRNLRHPNAATRLDAVSRLGEAGYVQAIEAVAPLVTDPDDRVQVAAIEAEILFFQATRSGGAGLLSVGGRGSRAQSAFEVGPLARAANPAPVVVLERLVAAMRDENARVRFDAVHALGFIAERPMPEPVAAALTAELDHYDPVIRAATARVLARQDVRSAGPSLTTALNDSSDVVRLYATEAIGVLRDAGGAISLRGQLARARGDLLEATFLALARVGAREDLEFFRVRFGDRNEVLRRAAVEGVGRAGDTDAIDRLTQMLEQDRSASVRAAAAFALSLLGRPHSHALGALMANGQVADQVRDYVLELGRPAASGLVEALKVSTDARHRAALVMLIGYVGGPGEVAVVEPLAGDGNEHIRAAATHALRRLRR